MVVVAAAAPVVDRRGILLTGAGPASPWTLSGLWEAGVLVSRYLIFETEGGAPIRVHLIAGAALLASPMLPQIASAGVISVDNLSGFQKADQRSVFQVPCYLLDIRSMPALHDAAAVDEMLDEVSASSLPCYGLFWPLNCAEAGGDRAEEGAHQG